MISITTGFINLLNNPMPHRKVTPRINRLAYKAPKPEGFLMGDPCGRPKASRNGWLRDGDLINKHGGKRIQHQPNKLGKTSVINMV